ncbi:MAG: helix-turn-helix domain-containing protein [Defluviitaleaceae bacterium]|nr:helix-turn-helix domain-containing protein [Defluviitaleaceae bacterium]
MSNPLKTYSIVEAANAYGIPVYALRRWINCGDIPACRSGRKYLVTAQNIESFLLNGNTQQKNEPILTGKIRRLV